MTVARASQHAGRCCASSPHAALPMHGRAAASCHAPASPPLSSAQPCPRRPAKPRPRFWKESSGGFILLEENAVLGVLRKAPGLGCVPILSAQWEPGEIIPVCHPAMSLLVKLKSALPKVSSHPLLWVKLTIF